MTQSSKKKLWILWGALTLVGVAYLLIGMLNEATATSPMLSSARSILVPGETTHGHHTIELSCETCHTSAFGGGELIQDACVSCHAKELELSDDSHPASKFDDPSNVERLDTLDAQQCITCHQEHRPDITHAMGVTLPTDFCAHCHSGEDEMPPDHQDLSFAGCTAAGCHNYHDNRALYEDYLVKHGGAAWLLEEGTVPARNFAEAATEMLAYPVDQYPLEALTGEQSDAPAGMSVDPKIHAEWLASSHAKNGVNCSACHVNNDAETAGEMAGKWVDQPGYAGCQSCHGEEIEGFLAGKHGALLAVGLGPMTPEKSRLPMKDGIHDKALSCSTCHEPHAPDTRKAAVESCMSCHDDEHTLAYKQSSHFQRWEAEMAGTAPVGSGVTCATCHMPRTDMDTEDGSRIVVQHNQNDTLRPNEKMIRPVCMNCHGLNFSIDALADPALIKNNFMGKPAKHVESVDMAVAKDAKAREKREVEKKQRAALAAKAAASESAEAGAEGTGKSDAEPTAVVDEYEEDFDEYN